MMIQTPKKKSVDYPFLLVLIFVIAVGGYWIVQEIRSQNLDPYLDFLGQRLMAVLPENKDKEKVQVLYDEFKENVRENKITPEDFENVAVEILNLHNLQDTLKTQQAEELLASVLPAPENLPEPPVEKSRAKRDRLKEFEQKKWQELGEKLGTIYEFENRVKEEQVKEKLRYRIDRGLQIIVDARTKEDLIKAKENQLIITLDNLEKEKVLVWSQDFQKDLQKQLDSLSVVLETYQDSVRIGHFKIPEVHVNTRIDSVTKKQIREYEARTRTSPR